MKFLNSAQHHAFCEDLGIGHLDSADTARTSPMRGSIRVDHCASNTNGKLEPAAAGTTNDSSLLNGFLYDLFQNDKIDLQNDSMTNESKKLFSFLNDLFGSKAS